MSAPPCQECRSGPRDVEGHAKLELHVAPASEGGHQRAAFKCGTCGLEWLRTYMGSGVFAWSRFEP